YQAGYSIILCNSYFDLEREQGHFELLLRQGVAGIITIPVDPTVEHVQQLIRYGIPCVVMGAEQLSHVDQVNVDVTMGAYLATRYLLKLGHRRIGLINGPQRVSACRARLEGYRRALAEVGTSLDEKLVVQGGLDEDTGAAAMARLLPRVSHDVTAVYAVNDVMAIGALRTLREAGLCVPDNVSLIGCDDIPVAAQLQPALTTVWQPKRELGRLAAKLILRQIQAQQEQGDHWQEEYPFQNAMYLPRVVERESTRSLVSEGVNA
ncbi:MAG TPA: LacI family transcriptional regulator, partial [Anaerolineae bacterium]|nr:LacI family transcriptional regulator [Anaerolineae bacterium]